MTSNDERNAAVISLSKVKEDTSPDKREEGRNKAQKIKLMTHNEAFEDDIRLVEQLIQETVKSSQ